MFLVPYNDNLVQDCSNSIANAMVFCSFELYDMCTYAFDTVQWQW